MATTKVHTNADDVTILATGEGTDRRRLVRVGDWELAVFDGRSDDEPRVSDEDFCARVGYGDVYKLRQRTRELQREDARNFNPLAISTERVEKRGRRGTRFFYSEHEALFLATQLATPQARALTHELIRVYMLARRGLLAPAPTLDLAGVLREALAPFAATVAALARRMSDVEASTARRVDGMEAALAANDATRGRFGRKLAGEVCAAIRDVADCYARRQTTAWRSRRMRVELAVLDASGLPKRAWEDQDPGRINPVLNAIKALRREGEAWMAEHGDPRQGDLPLLKPN